MRRFILGGTIVALALTPSAWCQAVESQQITGLITDPTGAAVPNAEVTVINQSTQLSKVVRSNGDGNYIVLNLPVGVYTVSTVVQGFKKSVLTGVHVDVGGKPAVNVTLEIGQVGEAVEVKADAVLVQTTSAEIGSVVTSEEATQIQLNGRNYIQLLTLSPGVSQTVASGFNLFGTYGVSGNAQSVNGIRTDSANYFIDGVDNKDNGGGGNNFVNISPDALQQFRNSASTYDASFGGTSGASVSVAIRSGGQQFHGVAYEYFRNDAIQAFQFIPLGATRIVKPPLRYNNFGYTIGGPIYIPNHFNTGKDKLFFFFAQDFKRVRQSSVSSITVPTTGQIAALLPTSTASGRALASSIIQQQSSSLTPGSFSYLNLTPNNQQEYLVKVDYNINEKNQLNGHFVHDLYTSLGNGTNYITFQRRLPGLTSSLQYTHTFNSKTVNVLVGSFSGNIILQTNGIAYNPQFGFKSILRSDYGINFATLYNASAYIPQISITGYGNPSATALNFTNYQRIYAGKDDFSRVIGNHALKAGIYAWRGRKNQTAPPSLNGALSFTSLANLLQGNYATYTEGSATPQVQARFTQIETYVQDDWTVNRRLTLNMGLRWQYMQPIYSSLLNSSDFYPTYYDPTHAPTLNPTTGAILSNPYPYNGLVLPGSGFPSKAAAIIPASVRNNPQVQALFHNLPQGLVDTHLNTFAPRIGFAYDVGGRQDTVVHGGFGLSYERVEGNYFYGSVSQAPFIASASLSAGNVDALGAQTSSIQNIGNAPDRNLAPPRIRNYSFGIQRRLTSNTVFDINYVGSGSGTLTWIRNLNQAPAGTQQAHPGVNNNALRPYLGWADINQYTNGAHTNYNSLQTRLLTRFQHGGTVNLAYTWSKALTEGSAYNYAPQDSFNLHGDYGPASYNQPQIFVASYVYPLPFWLHEHTLYKRLLSGWQLSGVTRISSGLPINVVQPGSQSTAGNAVFSVSQRPNIIGNPYAGAGKQYLTPGAFAYPAAGTYGNLEYDGIRGPHFNNWDTALQKNIPIHESVNLQFRAELFDVPNHISYFGVNGTLPSNPSTAGSPYTQSGSTFGQVTSATDPRTAEFVLRLNY